MVTDPETGQASLKRVDKYIPPLSPGWVRRNFTLGNILTTLTILGALMMFFRAEDVANVRTSDRVVALEAHVRTLETQSMSRETIDAKLDAISKQLVGIERRLDRIEQR